ncbi:hypothetical protein ACFVU3_08085 [Streptomyces sp. NPDC058052]|uniref:hypothetical protein n=1 Tax=Streptomyces sp. NPDC058052 TaxID=3346316 RepID=UPI0036E841ED
MPYATPDQLRLWLRLPEPFTADEAATAELLLDLAQGVIDDETGQSLESATDTLVLDSPTRSDPHRTATRSHRLVLPRWPVTAVDSVTVHTEDGDDQALAYGPAADYTWSADGILTRIGDTWPAHDRAITAVVTAGFITLPSGVTRISLRLAAAGWSNPEGLSAETLGDHSRSFSAEALGMELTAADKRALGAYRART